MANDSILFIKSSDVPVIMQLVGAALRDRSEWMGWKQNVGIVNTKSIRFFKDHSAAENFCWDPDDGRRFGGARLSSVYDALIAASEIEQGKKRKPFLTLMSLDNKDMVAPENSKLNVLFDDLTGQLKPLGADFGALRRNIVLELKSGKASFQLTSSVALSHERYILKFGVSKKNDGHYGLDTFVVSSIPIEKEWNGIDLLHLQSQMSEVKWARDFLNPVEQEKINKLIRTLGEMSDDPEGRVIADKLFDKYIKLDFASERFFKDDIKSAFYKQQTFPISTSFPIDIYDAINLLEGRSLYRHVPGSSTEKAWFGLHTTIKDGTGSKMLAQFHNAYNYDLFKGIDELTPFADFSAKDREHLVNRMENGNAMIIMFRFKDTTRAGLIYADIRDGSITIKNQSGGIFTRAFFPNPPAGKATYDPYVALWDSKLQRHDPQAMKSIQQNTMASDDSPESSQSRTKKR